MGLHGLLTGITLAQLLTVSQNKPQKGNVSKLVARVVHVPIQMRTPENTGRQSEGEWENKWSSEGKLKARDLCSISTPCSNDASKEGRQ
jgi:peptidyl-tRNA hydrolase